MTPTPDPAHQCDFSTAETWPRAGDSRTCPECGTTYFCGHDPWGSCEPSFAWHMARVKRAWIPEWLWRLFCRNPDPAARLPLRRPWRALLTRDARNPDEALRWWSA